MKQYRLSNIIAPTALSFALAAAMVGCTPNANAENSTSESSAAVSAAASTDISTSAADTSTSSAPAATEAASSSSAAASTAGPQGKMGDKGAMGGGMDTMPGETNTNGYTANDSGIAITATLTTTDAFTERDLAQTADTSAATSLSLADGKDITITEEGVYVISGSASESTIVVEAADTAKVQIVLDGVSITNTDFPTIYVKSADKVFVTLQGENTLEVTGTFVADGETSTDGVIFSKDDLCLNGTGSLTINSSEHGIVSKDDLKVTGGTYTISAAAGSGLRANDSVRIASGTFTINAEDGIKAKNDDDNELGYIYIQDGTFNITTTDNGIQGYAFVWIDGGTFKLDGTECIEGTYIQINDGEFEINASDDAINASVKSSVYTPTIEINGGTMTVNMASGDTDALDSNGYLYIKGGTLNLNAQSPFDYAWGAEMTGGEVYVNGQQITEIYDAMAGGMGGQMGGPGGMGGQMPQDGQMPEGMDSSQMPGGTPPDFANGERPQRPDGSSGFGGGPRDQAQSSTSTGTAA